MELDALRLVPLEPVHAEVRPHELPTGGLLLVGRGQDRQRPVDEEDELAAGPEETRRLRNPGRRIRPDGRAVLRDREVEARVRQRHRLRARLQEWELEPEALLHRTRGRELGRRDIDPDRSGAPAREPR
jgi:hypothetical protein